jgi:hypothetical protein
MKWWKELVFRFKMWQLDYCPKHLRPKQPPRYSFESTCAECASEESELNMLSHILAEKHRHGVADKLIKKHKETL